MLKGMFGCITEYERDVWWITEYLLIVESLPSVTVYWQPVVNSNTDLLYKQEAHTIIDPLSLT